MPPKIIPWAHTTLYFMTETIPLATPPQKKKNSDSGELTDNEPDFLVLQATLITSGQNGGDAFVGKYCHSASTQGYRALEWQPFLLSFLWNSSS